MQVKRTPVVPRLMTLMAADEAKGMPTTQDSIAQGLGVSQARVSEIVQRAALLGYITYGGDVGRNAGRRVTVYQLTASGREYAERQEAGPCK